jgi:uncharacterized membrane protein
MLARVSFTPETSLMAEYFSFQAALCFSIAHVLVRRGLVHSNALTGSFVSLATSAAVFWMLLPWFAPLSALRAPGVGYFIAAGLFAPAIGQTLGYLGIERIGVARSMPIVNSAPIFSSLLAVFFLGEVWVLQNIIGTAFVIIGAIILSSSRPAEGQWRKLDIIYPILGALAFGISTTLRKTGFDGSADPNSWGGGCHGHRLFRSVRHHSNAGRAPGARLESPERRLVARRRYGKYRRDSLGFFGSECRRRCQSGTINRVQSIA